MVYEMTTEETAQCIIRLIKQILNMDKCFIQLAWNFEY